MSLAQLALVRAVTNARPVLRPIGSRALLLGLIALRTAASEAAAAREIRAGERLLGNYVDTYA